MSVLMASPANREMTAPSVVQVNCTANGIGDAILGLTACHGLHRQDRTRRVNYVVHPYQADWVALFEGYDRLLTTREQEVYDVWPFETYAAQNAERLLRPRWEHYAMACGCAAALPWPRRLPEQRGNGPSPGRAVWCSRPGRGGTGRAPPPGSRTPACGCPRTGSTSNESSWRGACPPWSWTGRGTLRIATLSFAARSCTGPRLSASRPSFVGPAVSSAMTVA